MPVKTDQPPPPAQGGSYLYDPQKREWVRRDGTEQAGFVTHKSPPAAAPAAAEKE